jgi:phospholipid/cholesterol/gamma-HCH transport system substrate-binding protein
MKTRTVEIWVGFFVVLGITSLLMLALQVSGLSSFYHRDEGYKISASFQNIGGLKVRSKVTLGGVRIGRVTAINLKQNSYKEYQPVVEMTISSVIKNLPKDSTAKILTAGLLGDNYIGIEPGQDDKFLEDGDFITLTSQALLLEELISKFAVGK